MSGRGRFNTRSTNNQGYQKQSYNTRNSYSSPAYSTPTGGYQKDQQQQQHHTPQQQQQQQQHHTPQHQQYHQEQKQVAPTPQQHATPPTPQQQKPEPPPVLVATPKIQPPVQTPQATPKPENNLPVDDDVKMGDEEEDGKKKIGKSWFKRRVSGTPDFKVPRRIRKRRQNARLKNILAPKNAMMVLHELHPELKMSVTEQVNAANQQSYTVEIEIDGQMFKGMGMSKMAAKQAGSEAALKAVLLKKLEENNEKLSAQNAANKVEGGWEEDVSMTDVSDTKSNTGEGGDLNGAAAKPKNPIPEDDVPWGSLASFALYKLFSEWQSQGFQLPAVSGLQNVVHPKPTALPQTPMKKLPDDAHTKHPVQLLNQIRPGSQYIESREGVPPSLTFTFSVIIDDLTFKGVGTSKKDAKKQCAKHALEHLGVVYTDQVAA